MSRVVLYFSTTTTELTAKKSEVFSKIYVFIRPNRFCVEQFMPKGKYDNNNNVHVPFVYLYIFRYWAFMFGLCSIGIKTKAGGRNVHQFFLPSLLLLAPSRQYVATVWRRVYRHVYMRVPSTGPKNVSTAVLHNNNNTLLLFWLSTARHITIRNFQQ